MTFHENPSSGGQTVPCRQTGITKLIVDFRNFGNTSINATFITVYFPFAKFVANKMGMPKAQLLFGVWQQMNRWSQKRDILYAYRSLTCAHPQSSSYVNDHGHGQPTKTLTWQNNVMEICKRPQLCTKCTVLSMHSPWYNHDLDPNQQL